MLSLISSTNHLIAAPIFAANLNFPAISSLALSVSPRRSKFTRWRPEAACFQLVTAKEGGYLGFSYLGKRHYESSWCSWCKPSWDSEGDLALEAEILEFMRNSKKPEVFPTKEELVDAGRMDLAEGIVKKGGWLSLGWDLDEENVEENEKVEKNWDNGGFDDGAVEELKQRVESCQESDSFDRDEVGSFELSSASENCSESASPSGRSLELGTEEDTGIEGILAGLEKQRNLSFGINVTKKGSSSKRWSRKDEGGQHFEAPTDGSGKLSHNINASGYDGSRNSLKPEMWRTWSIQRAGDLNSEFEAAEISFDENHMGTEKDISKDEILAIRKGASSALDRRKNIDQSHIRTRLQHMELELASALQLLLSKSEKLIPEEGNESSSNDLRKLSDAWEFQETEIMNGQDRLRSIRAKLVVLEGKMALALIDAQRMVEEKQKRVDGARRALQLLRTTYIIWPNSGSEVLLTGSFDGWITQRKMEKSGKGIFSVCLKLYPGRYEIKFIVDGIWKTDPLRPIVRNSGNENNLLVIT